MHTRTYESLCSNFKNAYSVNSANLSLNCIVYSDGNSDTDNNGKHSNFILVEHCEIRQIKYISYRMTYTYDGISVLYVDSDNGWMFIMKHYVFRQSGCLDLESVVLMLRPFFKQQLWIDQTKILGLGAKIYHCRRVTTIFIKTMNIMTIRVLVEMQLIQIRTLIL